MTSPNSAAGNEDTANQPEENKNSTPVFSEGILLAMVTAGAYLTAFYYERSFAGYFGIPPELINISIVNLFIVGALMLSTLLSVFMPLNLLFMLRPRNMHPVLKIMAAPVVFVLILALIAIYMVGLSAWIYWSIFIILALIVGIVYLAVPAYIHRSKGKYINRLEAQLEIDVVASANTNSLTDLIIARFGWNLFGVICLFLIANFFATLAGLAAAQQQRKFLVTNTDPEMVVIRTYGENLICAPFDRNKKDVQRSFIILKITGDPKLSLRLENIGPLNPVDVQAAPPSPTPQVTPSTIPSTVPTPEQQPSVEPSAGTPSKPDSK